MIFPNLLILAIYAGLAFSPASGAPGDSQVPLQAKPSVHNIPADCGIVASEAAARLASTGVWTRVLFCSFYEPQQHRLFHHILCVWQPATAKSICAYDDNGTFDLDTEDHDCKSVALALARRIHVVMLEAYYLK